MSDRSNMSDINDSIRAKLANLAEPIAAMIQACIAIDELIGSSPDGFIPRSMTGKQSQIGSVPAAGTSAPLHTATEAEEWQTKRLLGSAWGSSKDAISKLGQGIGSTIMVPTKITGAIATGTGDILTGLGKLPNAIARQTAKIKIKSPFSGGGKSPRGYKKINNNTKKKK